MWCYLLRCQCNIYQRQISMLFTVLETDINLFYQRHISMLKITWNRYQCWYLPIPATDIGTIFTWDRDPELHTVCLPDTVQRQGNHMLAPKDIFVSTSTFDRGNLTPIKQNTTISWAMFSTEFLLNNETFN